MFSEWKIVFIQHSLIKGEIIEAAKVSSLEKGRIVRPSTAVQVGV